MRRAEDRRWRIENCGDLRSSILNPRPYSVNERGVALLVVLWIFIFLFVVAFDFASSVREEGMATHRYSEEAEGYYLALAGFEEVLYNLLKQSSQPGQGGLASSDVLDGSWHDGSLGEGSYRARVVDEGGKININRVDEETLRRIFTNLGVDAKLTSVLVDSILDWRDEDNLHRLSGAEDDYYLSLSPPYTARNGPLDTIEDLLWIRGVTPELFYGSDEGGVRTVGLRDILTVDSPTYRVNLRTASPEVIHALTGLPLEKCRQFVEQRKQLSEQTLADVLKLLGIAAGDAAMRQFVFTNPTVISVEAAGRHGDSASQRQVKGVVRLLGAQRGFLLVRWVDRDTVRE